MEDLTIGSEMVSGPLRLVVALGVGLLIGMEREWRWRQKEQEPKIEHAGLRTFGLIGLFIGPMILAALWIVWREWLLRPASHEEQPTTPSSVK